MQIMMNGEGKVIFISYAWENEKYKSEVWELASWITVNMNLLGIPVTVLTDHLFSSVPPSIGWHRWITKSINNADIVLICCSQSYKNYFEGLDDDNNKGGFGVTFEGTVITANLYKQKGKNQKYYPILPENGEIEYIPTILEAYFNGIKFSSENSKIIKLIIGKNPQHNSLSDLSYTLETSNLLSETIIALENEISEDINNSVENTNPDMNYDIKILIQSYLSLTDLEKTIVIRKIVEDFEPYKALNSFEKDKIFLKEISEQKKINILWEEINKIKPFENSQNPF